MTKKKVVLTFPTSLLNEPITYHLIKDYDLMVNILMAKANPNEEGILVLEITGKKLKLDEGFKYLEAKGAKIQSLARDIKWYEKRCTHCTACISTCPTGAFFLDRENMLISFNKEKCIACELCLKTCPYKAIEIVF